jgi:hypothetical protein
VSLSPEVVAQVRLAARERCEYCHLPESAFKLGHVVDHVIARQHGGGDTPDNLALCCRNCNRYKGPNLSAIDPDTRATVRLFHPRRDVWEQHFEWSGPILRARTPIGRGTVALLAMNQPLRVLVREALMAEGVALS